MLFDIAIVGAGLVGASLARALTLKESALSCALIEGAAPSEPRSDSWDPRVYALSPASQRFLERIGVWEALDARRMAPVFAMQVYGDSASRLDFVAYDCGAERLATIVEAGAVQRALWRLLQDQQGVELVCPARPVSLEPRADCIVLGLADREPLQARLLVGADGANSWVREAALMPLRRSSETHAAVVASFACEKAHRGTAFQWFRSDGVLAWLPLPGKHFSMVWSTDEASARSLLAAPARELCTRVAEAGAHALGTLEVVTAPSSFPIAPAWVSRRTRPRIVLIGDAAHVVHPLAGQGVNLGFGDAASLAALLHQQGSARRDPGDWLALRRFERERSGDILAMRIVTQGLQRLFSARSGAVAQLRNLGLNVTDRLPFIKNLLARQAMGTA